MKKLIKNLTKNLSLKLWVQMQISYSQSEVFETSRDLEGYLEPLTHLCTVLNIANESCIRSQEITLA